MADTTFTDGETEIVAAWLNAINDFYYTLFAGATTAGAARTALGSTAVGDALFIAASATAAQQAMDTEVGVDVQAYDADLAALAALATTGLLARTGAGTAATRTITAASASVVVTNGDGVSGNPTVEVAAATDALAGKVELSTTAEMQAGSSTTVATTPAAIKGALGFSNYFQSTAQTITAAGSLTIAHGLSAQPILVMAELNCTSGEHGYSAGDDILAFGFSNFATSTNAGVVIIPDATNLNIRFASNATGTTIYIVHKTSGNIVGITNASWTITFRAWA